MKQLLCLIAVIFLSFGLLLSVHSQNELTSIVEIDTESGYEAKKQAAQLNYADLNPNSGGPVIAQVRPLFPHNDEKLWAAQNTPKEEI